MSSVKILGKRAVFVLFSLSLLVACSQTTRQWQLTSNEGVHTDFCSSRLSLAPESSFSGLEVDIFSTTQGRLIYINVFGLELEPEGKNSDGNSTITVTTCIDDQSLDFMGFLLQGGHRILLPENASHIIIEALHNNKTVVMTVSHYSTTIIPDNFVKHYQELSK